jgi:hypothetical protein
MARTDRMEKPISKTTGQKHGVCTSLSTTKGTQSTCNTVLKATLFTRGPSGDLVKPTAEPKPRQYSDS